ncbi:hypothetical protein MSG28_008320 [Choristoneura fumiferana]|uniref:Uncharacterized protein n=1 Tax=Choristoneura fumiferana TaxID=7141 RepID=A0ACC0JAX2_CHOFU|nr:hypothetical protein MSG28_008320 [Choristoneura fumiferana]
MTLTVRTFYERDFPDDSDGDPILTSAIPEDTPHIPYKPLRRSDDEVLQRSREYYELMAKRRTVRMFSPEPIPDEVLDNIIMTAGVMDCIPTASQWAEIYANCTPIANETYVRATVMVTP